MASPTPPAMTPEQALQTLATVRGYRERLTARAAGTVWMVWGFALALLASADMLALAADEPPMEDGWGVRMDGAAIATSVVALGALLAGVLVTNAVWRAHSIERGEPHRAWVSWVAVGALLLVTAAIGVATVEVLSRTTDPDELGGMNAVLLMPLFGALGAAIITVLQRRRVQAWPGVVAAVLLLALQFALPLAVDVARESQLVMAIQASSLGILVAFVATGLYYHKHG